MATTLLPLLLLASLAAAQTTSTATILLPNVCTLQAEPSVTIVAQNNDLTTYTYNCANYVKPTRQFLPFTSQSSTATNGPVPTTNATTSPRISTLPRFTAPFRFTDAPTIAGPRRTITASHTTYIIDNSCGRFGRREDCIPWEITQGASYWAAHITLSDPARVSLEMRQECTFGDGGIANGPATCEIKDLRTNATGWSSYSTVSKVTLARPMVDGYFFRNTVVVTAPGPAETGPASTGPASTGPVSSGLAVPRSVPTGVAAAVVGAGGILAAALVL